MDCVLLRHGIGVERDEWEGPDADRSLTERGAKRVIQVAAGLSRLDVQPTHVLSSPLIRAFETAKIVHSALRVCSAVHVVDEFMPDAPPNRLLSILHDLLPESCVLCVSHEPTVGHSRKCPPVRVGLYVLSPEESRGLPDRVVGLGESHGKAFFVGG